MQIKKKENEGAAAKDNVQWRRARELLENVFRFYYLDSFFTSDADQLHDIRARITMHSQRGKLVSMIFPLATIYIISSRDIIFANNDPKSLLRKQWKPLLWEYGGELWGSYTDPMLPSGP